MTEQQTGPVVADRSTLRLALVVGGLVLAMLAGFALGRVETGLPAAGKARSGTAPAGVTATGHTHSPGTAPHSHSDTATAGGTSAASAGGLSLSGEGFTLAPVETAFRPGVGQDFRFQIRGADRKPVTRFVTVHDKRMHLIVVRRDLSGYQHLHPEMAADGTWVVPLTLPGPGIWRAYTDFTALDAAGRPVATTLGVDLVAAGAYTPRALPVDARTVTVGDLTVSFQGTPQVGGTTPLMFRVYAAGTPVTGPERYLGAYGHLVALRDGDLGYLHVHPEEQLTDGAVKFWLTAPSPGRYRLFFDFQVGGVVRTAEFTVTVP